MRKLTTAVVLTFIIATALVLAGVLSVSTDPGSVSIGTDYTYCTIGTTVTCQSGH